MGKIFAILFLLTGLSAHAEEIVLGCIDCYSSFSLAPAIAQKLAPTKKAKWILIQTHAYSDEHLHYLKYFPADAEKIILDPQSGVKPLDGSLSAKQVVEALRAKNVAYVFGGMDKGSYASPLINGPLGFLDNSLESRDLRLKKDVSAAAAGRYGIPTHELTDVDLALRWLEQFPEREVILKLNSGAGGDRLEFLSKDKPEHLRERLAANVGSFKNYFQENEKFIVQPKINGRKFYANSYTFNGHTVLTGVAEYHMIDWQGTVLYCFDEFLDLSSPEAKKLQIAVEEVNAKLGVHHGPAHPEFILDERTGEFKLIEMNARISGAGVPAMEHEVYGLSQLDLHLMSVLDPVRFQRELTAYPRKMQKSGIIFFAPSPAAGKLNETALREIKSHKSYFSPGEQYELKGGDVVVENKDQSTSAGTFYFTGERGTVEQGIDRAVDSFSQGKLIDFSNPSPNVCKQDQIL